MSRLVTLVAAARPNFMKIEPIRAALVGRVETEFVHTGQHYDRAMSDAFFVDLGIPAPDVDLGVGSGSHGEQTGRALIELERHLMDRRPAAVVVVGDVNSTLAAALAAAKLGIRVAHVEAGLRSGDWSMPEEINRVLTDRLADWLFTPSADADENLADEGIDPKRIHLVGNVMIDTLLRLLPEARKRNTAASLRIGDRSYGVVTLHRPSNVDDPNDLETTLAALGRVSQHLPLVFPIHPRSRASITASGAAIPDGITTIDPIGYLDFLSLVDTSALVLTDSGGIQEETTVLGIPCLTMRDNTERPITVTHGTNRVVGTDPDTVEQAFHEVIERPRTPTEIPLWDGKAGQRIADILDETV